LNYLSGKILNHNIIEKARREIIDSSGGKFPKVLDPYAGGGSIPLETVRLGCQSYSSDYNPVAVLIQKCLIEYPQKYSENNTFKDEKHNKTLISEKKEKNRLHEDVKKCLENQLKTYAIDRTAYIDEMVFKRMAELEDNQTILRNIIDNPEAQIKAVAELNETTILISQLFEMLPIITRLGVDAFPSVFKQTQTQTQTGKNDNSLLSGSGSGGGQ
jgi:hypothetical protein